MSERMSTNIDDLPGPEEVQNDDRTNQMANMNNNVNVNLNRNDGLVNNSNITVDIHKKPKEKFEKSHESYYDLILSSINKENILLLLILYIATLRQSDEYTRKFLLNIPFNLANNSFVSTLIKCIALVILYLLIKQHI